jgi:hypothetical protein
MNAQGTGENLLKNTPNVYLKMPKEKGENPLKRQKNYHYIYMNAHHRKGETLELCQDEEPETESIHQNINTTI